MNDIVSFFMFCVISVVIFIVVNYFIKSFSLFQKTKSFPDNKVLAVDFSKKPELKKYMKRVMPFVQATREKVEQLGPKALALTLEFDEAEVLKANSVYLANTLNVEEVIVKFTDDESAQEKMKECCPGAPFVQFLSKPSVRVTFVNPTPHSGLFSKYIAIRDNDTYGKVVQKLVKDIKSVKSEYSKGFYFFFIAQLIFEEGEKEKGVSIRCDT